MMGASFIGGLIGLVIAAVDFYLLRMFATRVDLPETKQVLKITGISQFVLLPIMGWFIGPMIAGV